jgi:phenylacetate-CoA ligase
MIRKMKTGSLITPGLKKDDILHAIEQLSFAYEQTILIGYPPFIKDIVDIAIERGYNFGANPPGFLFAAESFPEAWRKHVHAQVHPDSKEVTSINIYGSADLGFIGHETSYTVALRSDQTFITSDKVYSPHFIPPLYQYHPWHMHIEVISEELIVTSDSTIPLIRYNTKDRGAHYRTDELPTVHGVPRTNIPVIAIYGRSDVLATFYGINIFPEHIRHILAHETLVGRVSGKFAIASTYDTDQNQQLEVHVEMNPGEQDEQALAEMIKHVIITHLGEVNHEYQKLLAVIDIKAHPIIHVHTHGAPAFQAAKMKQRYVS